VTRALLEGLVIVVSILLAFGLEASWSARAERRDAMELLLSISADIEENRALVARHLEGTDRYVALTQSVLEVLASGERGASADSTLAGIGNVFTYPTWDPINDAYQEAKSSGRLALIQDPALRLLLTRYQSRIDAMGDLVDAIRTQYYGQIEPFLVANTVYTDVAVTGWSEEVTRVRPPFQTDFEALRGSRELWNLLTVRLELAVAQKTFLERVDARARAIQEHIVLPR